MKKFDFIKTLTAAAMVMVMAFALSACGEESSPEAVQPEEQIDYEVALVTDDSLIMDGGHSEMAWNAISLYCAENGLSHKYYKATDNTKRAYEKAIDIAVENGAKIVIADNNSLSDAVYEAEEEYEDVDFMILNSYPVDEENGDIRISENTVAVTFASEEAGYLAGYAAVKEGYTDLGFIGQARDKEFDSYGYGFVMGADKAAEDTDAEITMRFINLKSGEGEDDANSKAEKWFGKDVQVIMASGSKAERGVIRAAEFAGGKVICCQADKSAMSDTVLTTAEIKVDSAINDILAAYTKGNFPGGSIITYNAANDGVGLALKVNGFKNLTQKDYDGVYEELAKGKIKVNIDGVEKTSDIEVKNITIK